MVRRQRRGMENSADGASVRAFMSRALFFSYPVLFFCSSFALFGFFLELLELLFGGGAFRDFDDVEANRLGKRTALAHRHRVTDGDVAEAGREMSGDVSVSFLESLVFPDEMKIVPPEDDGSLHLQLPHDSAQNSPADLYEAGEGTLLVDVVSILGLLGSLETQTNILHVADLFRLRSGDESRFVVEEDILLLLESTFRLVRHLVLVFF